MLDVASTTVYEQAEWAFVNMAVMWQMVLTERQNQHFPSMPCQIKGNDINDRSASCHVVQLAPGRLSSCNLANSTSTDRDR